MIKDSAAVGFGYDTMATEMKNQILARGLEPADTPPEEFGRWIRADIERWKKVIRAAGIKTQ